MNVVIVGGHGQIALRLARLLAARPNVQVTSLFRDAAHTDEVAATGASPVVLSLEDDPKEKFAAVFEGKDLVYFAAGSGGKGAPERATTVDYEGAVKVFDALELVKGPKPRLILVSSIDVRDRSVAPPHYTEADLKASDDLWGFIPTYMQAKYSADKNLVQRTAFKWTIIRPNYLSSEPGTGKALIGKAPFAGGSISRDDVALTLALLADRPDAAGLAIDLTVGDTNIEEGLDAFIKKGETDFLG